MAGQERHAVVIGASIAGVLAARVLAEHYDRVTLVDRDEMPSRPVIRGGVPQGRHVHGLLVPRALGHRGDVPRGHRGPGGAGAQLGDAQADGRYFFGPEPLAAGHADLPALGVGGRCWSGTCGTGCCATSR